MPSVTSREASSRPCALSDRSQIAGRPIQGIGGGVDDPCPAIDGHPAQLVVSVAGLDADTQPRVASKVDRLLGLGLGLETDMTVDDPLPHGHLVRVSAGAVGRECGDSAANQKVPDLPLAHGDLGSLIRHGLPFPIGCTLFDPAPAATSFPDR
jgi:hypothetical protein